MWVHWTFINHMGSLSFSLHPETFYYFTLGNCHYSFLLTVKAKIIIKKRRNEGITCQNEAAVNEENPLDDAILKKSPNTMLVDLLKKLSLNTVESFIFHP